MQDLSRYSAPAPAPVVLEGRFVRIEPYDEAQHLQDLWTGLGGAAGINRLIRFFPNDDFADIAPFAAWLRDANADGRLITHVIRSKASGDVVGMASFMRPDPRNGVIEIGSVAHGAAMQRTPMATEAHYLLARHVFDGLGYRRYEWKCHNDNGPSKVTALRYGFVFEGIFRQHMISKGGNRDTAWFSIIDKDWPGVGAAFAAWLDPQNFEDDGRQKQRLEDIRASIAGTEGA